MSLKPREVVAAIESGKLTVEAGLRQLEGWQVERETERRRLERRERPRPAHWLGIRIVEGGSRRRFNLWLPMFLVHGGLSMAGWIAPRAMRWGKRRYGGSRRWGLGDDFELSPSQLRAIIRAVRQSLVAVGPLVEVDDHGRQIEIWLR
ncbi:MAG: hypothetical protein ACYC6I_06250 [Bacillota bacterium]